MNIQDNERYEVVTTKSKMIVLGRYLKAMFRDGGITIVSYTKIIGGY